MKAAAKVYEPVLKNLEKRQKKLRDAVDKEHVDFMAQAENLRRQRAEYERKTAELAEKIRGAGKSSAVENFFDAVSRDGMFGASSAQSFGGIMYDSWSLANHLERKMNEKREHFYRLEFEEKSRVWQSKIADVRKEILALIKKLRELKSADEARIQKITAKVDEALDEYCEAAAKFYALEKLK